MSRIGPKPRFSRPLIAGFGLVEIMVGLAIGMIATLVIVQVAAMFEGQKRSTTGTADAQTTGSMAIYSIQRQIQMAGYGLPVFSTQNQALNCTNDIVWDNDNNAGTPAITVNAQDFLSPVTIAEGGGSGASDTITVHMGTTPFGGVPIKYAGGLSPTDEKALSCQKNDVVLIVAGSTCALTTVTQAPPTAGEPKIVLASTPALDGTLACLGQWQAISYQVNGGNLLENGSQIAGGVVNMQARYGISNSPLSNQVVQYVDANDAVLDDRRKIKAIRVALVIRNSVLEKENVTAACSSLTAAAPTGLCAWAGTDANPAPVIDLSADQNWRRYRYRVFDTTIPIRNMIWSADKL